MWGLIELRDNGTIQCEWKLLSENTYKNLDELLADFSIDKDKYSELKEL